MGIDSEGRSKRVLVTLCTTLAAITAAGVRASQAQSTPPSFSEVVAAGYHTGYEALQRTSIINKGRQSWFDASITQDAAGPRSVRVTAPPRRSGEMEVDDGSYRWRYQPRLGVVTLMPSMVARHHKPGGNQNQAAMDYVGADTVAGRAATIYSVTPIRPGSPLLRMWVDCATLVPLRTDWTTRDGRQISQAFVRVTMGGRRAVHFAWPSGARLQVKSWPNFGPKAVATEVDMPLALPTRLPPGVLFDGVWLRELAARQVLWFHFHQGRRDASLFETLQGPQQPVLPGNGVENWNLGPLNLTLVGSLPPAAQARIRGSIRLVRK